MNLKCIFGFHTWDGRKCSGCGKASPEEEARFLKAAAEGDSGDMEARLNVFPGLVFAKDAHKNMPLHLAAEKDHVAVAQLLINHKAIVDAINQRGDTPLDVAACKDSERVGELLLDIAEAGIVTSIDTVRKGGCGLPSNWDGDKFVLKALDLAKKSGSHRMAARLHRVKAGVHRTKAQFLTERANSFAKLYNATVAGGGPGGLMRGFASEEAHEAEVESRKAQEEDLAADREMALSVKADGSRKIQAEQIDQ